MREIVPGIDSWSQFSEPHGYDFNGYLVHAARSGNLCIDPVEPGEDNLAAIAGAGAAYVVLTNRNHSRAADAVRSRTGARTLIHAADAPHARAQGTAIDGELREGASIGPFRIVGVAGKSPGEVALHWPERRLLIVGDAVIGHPPGRCSLLREKVLDDAAALRRSVRRLLELDFDILLPGDGAPILADARSRLAELVATFPS
jgi:glyoxylase-like metal-dependent hydrolase (beta-lactamase superfamily II)